MALDDDHQDNNKQQVEEERRRRSRSGGGSFPFTTTTTTTSHKEESEDPNISLNPDTRLSTYQRPEVRAQNQEYQSKQASQIANKVVLKEIKYFNELTHIQKMQCQTALMQGIIRGYTIPDLPAFIRIKTKLNLSIPVIQQLIKNQKAEDKQWYYHMARDNIAYVSSYRKAITSIEEYQREIWLLTISPKSDADTKLNCYKELHALTKTLVLLLRDLPFITQLSRYYDIDKITEEYANRIQKQPIEEKIESNKMGYNPIRRLANRQRQLVKESGLYINNDEALQSRKEFDTVNVNLAYKILDDVKSNKIYHSKGNNPNKITDEVMESMNAQMQPVSTEDTTNKLQQQAAVEYHLSKIEKEIDELGGIDNIPNNEKLKEIMNKYEDSLSFLDAFLTDDQRESIRNVRKLKED